MKKAGININKKYNDLGYFKKRTFSKIYAKYEGYKGRKGKRRTTSEEVYTYYNDANSLNSELIVYGKKQSLVKISIYKQS